MTPKTPEWTSTPPTEPGWYVYAFTDTPHRLEIAKLGANGYEEKTESWAAPFAEWPDYIWHPTRIPEPSE